MATALGAAVTDALTAATTHVVAENPSTEKVYHARQRGGAVAVVTRTWLQLSFWHCERKPEADFPLLGKGAAAAVAGAGKPPAPAPAPAPAAAAAEREDGDGEQRAAKRAKVGGEEGGGGGSGPSPMDEAAAEEGEEDEALAQALADELG